MRDSGDIFAHRALKEHDVSGLHLVIRHGAAQAVQSLGAQPAGVADAAGCEHIRDKAGAVEAGFRACAAPDIRIADVLGRFLHQRCKRGISIQDFLRNVVERWVAEWYCIRVAGEDALHIAMRGHVQRVHAHGVMAHADNRQMGEVLVLQLHVTDAVRIGHLHVIGVHFGVLLPGDGVGHDARSGSRLRPVPGFC